LEDYALGAIFRLLVAEDAEALEASKPLPDGHFENLSDRIDPFAAF